MANFRQVIAILVVVFACSFAAQVELSDTEYPNVEVPGLASPFVDLDEAFYEIPNRPNDQCCFPDNWQGNMTTRGGGRFGNASIALYVDSIGHRVVGRGGSGNHTFAFYLFFDNKTNVSTVVVQNTKSQKCVNITKSASRWRSQCVPKNASFVSTFSLGPTSQKFLVDLYTFGGRSTDSAHGFQARVRVSFLVTRQASLCYPVFVQSSGGVRGLGDEENDIDFESDVNRGGSHGRGSTSNNAYFSDMGPIIDWSEFNVPQSCYPTSSKAYLTYDAQSIPDVVESFIEF